MNKKNIKEVFLRFEKNNPKPKGELIYISPYTLLVAVVLSAQATDISVNKATKNLFRLAFYKRLCNLMTKNDFFKISKFFKIFQNFQKFDIYIFLFN